MSHRNRLFVFSLIYLVHMGRWMKPVMFIRKVIEVIQVHLGWKENFVSGCGGGGLGIPHTALYPRGSGDQR